MLYKILIVFLTIVFAGTQVQSQIPEQLATKLTKEYESNAKELIVLQPDKSIYQAGTEIWFRIYSVSSNGFTVDNKDKVIYVELANESDSVIERVLLNKEALQYHGSIPIPAFLEEGFYQVRTYTKTILQTHPQDVFVTPVYITNNGNRKESISRQNSDDPAYKFYAEGDNLMNGVSSVVVFTASDKDGIPLPVSGYVKDNFGNEMTKFSGNGIGKFAFEPYSKDRTYKVYIKTNSGTEQVYSLPAIKTGTFQLSLQKQTPLELVFRIALGDSAYKQKASSYLLGIAGGKICFASEGKAMYMVNIPVNTLPHGLVDFYLFDENKELRSRRTVFNENYNSTITIAADKQEYGSRQKAKLNFNVTDNEGKPVKAVFSVSITDKKLVGENLPVHAADLYRISRNSNGLMINNFISNNETRDLVAMLTGSEDELTKNIPGIKTDNDFYWDGLEIKGSVWDKQGTPLTGQIVVMMPEQDSTTLNDSTDNKGEFVFRDMTFYGKKRFHVMIPSVYDKQMKYDIEQQTISFPVIHSRSLYDPGQVSIASLPSFAQQHADSSVAGSTRIYLQQLKLQEETGKKKSQKAAKPGLAPRRITAEQLDKLSLSNTADAVKMMPGVMMMGGRLTIRGGLMTPTGDLSDIEPLLVVDGVQTRAGSVVDYLNSIPPSQIEYIEVLTGPDGAIYGTRGGNGVIIVKTSNQIRDNKKDKEKQTIVASGFYKEQNFYEPPYDSYAVREASFVDNRATIYWNGQVITDDAGKATVSFYTADLKNDYNVTVQGITEKGDLIFKTYTIKKK